MQDPQLITRYVVKTRAVTQVGSTRVELELDLSQLGRVGFSSTRVFELDFYVLRGQILGQLRLKLKNDINKSNAHMFPLD